MGGAGVAESAGENRGVAYEHSLQVYRSPLARWGSYAWFVLAALNLFDIGLRGGGQSGRVAFAAVLAATVLVYLVAFRPAVVVGGREVVLRNVLRDVTVPWSDVTQVDATDALRVHAGERTYRSWAVHTPSRERMRAGRKSKLSVGERGSVPDSVASELANRTHADFVADKVREARDRWRREGAVADPGQPADQPVDAAADPYRRLNVSGTVLLAAAVALVVVAVALP